MKQQHGSTRGEPGHDGGPQATKLGWRSCPLAPRPGFDAGVTDMVAATLCQEVSRVLAEPPAPGRAGGGGEPGCSPCTSPTGGFAHASSSWGTAAPEMGTATLPPSPLLHHIACTTITITNASAQRQPCSRAGQTLRRDNLALQHSPGPGHIVSPSRLGNPQAVAVLAPPFG